MSSVTIPFPPGPSPEPVFRLSVQQYHAMIEAGVLTEDDPVELLEGILVFKRPKNPAHPLAVRFLTTLIDAMLLGSDWHFRAQEPVTLDDSEPEPDGAIVRGEVRDYLKHHPGRSEIGLVVEVSDTSLARDRGIKLRGYARASISPYWIVDLIGRSVEVYWDPDAEASPPAYRKRIVFDESSIVPIELNGKPVGAIKVAAILP
jgi:Uma2 family endonuclease